MTEKRSLLSRLRFETVGSITAIVVGVIALWVSYDQAQVMRQDIRASVWPALQVQGFVDTQNGLAIGLNIENAGVGPALIERITVRHGQSIVADIEDLRSRIDESADISFDTATGRILASGNAFRPFVFRTNDPAGLLGVEGPVDPLMASRAIAGWTAEVCYCSSLGDCWLSDTTTNPPAEIDSCDADEASAL